MVTLHNREFVFAVTSYNRDTTVRECVAIPFNLFHLIKSFHLGVYPLYYIYYITSKGVCQVIITFFYILHKEIENANRFMYNIDKGILYSYIDIYNNILLCKFYKNIYINWVELFKMTEQEQLGAARKIS